MREHGVGSAHGSCYASPARTFGAARRNRFFSTVRRVSTDEKVRAGEAPSVRAGLVITREGACASQR